MSATPKIDLDEPCERVLRERSGAGVYALPAQITVRLAETAQELECIYRFRYRIYVEEMNRPQRYANHERRRIKDPLDSKGINLAAWNGNAVVGVIRSNASADDSLASYERFYEMSCVGADHPALTSITTRLMIDASYRKGGVAIRLADASYVIGLQRGIRWNFIDCNDHLVSLFTHLGWKEYAPCAEHPEYGFVHRMRLNLEDIEHLEQMRSSFAQRYHEFHKNRSSYSCSAALMRE